MHRYLNIADRSNLVLTLTDQSIQLLYLALDLIGLFKKQTNTQKQQQKTRTPMR